MVLFPQVQVKAQAELDGVVGNERLPSFDDRDSLPYINAVWKEVLRWHTVTPLGTVASSDGSEYTHLERSTAPRLHGRYLLRRVPDPKRIVHHRKCVVSIVPVSLYERHPIGCLHRAVLHDEATYPDPFVFRPERFLGETPQPDPQNVCFGFGRRQVHHLFRDVYAIGNKHLPTNSAALYHARVCPGMSPLVRIHPRRHLLPSQVITSQKRCSSFRWPCLSLYSTSQRTWSTVSRSRQRSISARGRFREYCFFFRAWVTPNSSTRSHPKPFKCKITARSSRAETLLQS